MQRNSNWYAVLRDLASWGCISTVCIDEVHSSVQNYESFRPEFKSAMDFFNQLVTISRNSTTRSHFYVPILAMSARLFILWGGEEGRRRRCDITPAKKREEMPAREFGSIRLSQQKKI